jgi:hypothetical protein
MVCSVEGRIRWVLDLSSFADDHILILRFWFLCLLLLSSGLHWVLSMSSILRDLALASKETQTRK